MRREGKTAEKKAGSTAGLARIHVLLLLLCILLALMIYWPRYRAHRQHAQEVACMTSLRVVNGALVLDMISRGNAASLDDTAQELVSTLPGRDGYCPSGGTVYFLKQKNGEWKAVCGMHDEDPALRTRLNASYVLSQVRDRVNEAKCRGAAPPEEVTAELNGKKLSCVLVEAETGIRRGTATTAGYERKGTVAFYGLEGRGSFQDTGAKAGEICYFCLADPENSAVWNSTGGWSGSAFGDSY